MRVNLFKPKMSHSTLSKQFSVAQQWTITHFSDLSRRSKHHINSEHPFIESPEFFHSECNNLKYRLHLYHNGKDSTVASFVSLFIYVNSYIYEVDRRAVVKVYLQEPDGSAWNAKVIETTLISFTEHGFTSWFSRSFLLDSTNRFLLDDSLTIYFQVSILSSSDDSSHNFKTLSTLPVEIFRVQTDCSDVPFNVAFHRHIELAQIDYEQILNSFKLMNNVKNIEVNNEESFGDHKDVDRLEVDTESSHKSVDSFVDYFQELLTHSSKSRSVSVRFFETHQMDRLSSLSTLTILDDNIEAGTELIEGDTEPKLDSTFDILENLDAQFDLNSLPSNLPNLPLSLQSLQNFDQLFMHSILHSYERRLLRKLKKGLLGQAIRRKIEGKNGNVAYHFENSNFQNVVLSAHSRVKQGDVRLGFDWNNNKVNYEKIFNWIPIALLAIAICYTNAKQK